MTGSPNTLALACVAAAGAARNHREAYTVCATEAQGGGYVVYASQQYAVLRENHAADHLIALATFYPGGRMEVYPAAEKLPFFQSRINTDDVQRLPEGPAHGAGEAAGER